MTRPMTAAAIAPVAAGASERPESSQSSGLHFPARFPSRPKRETRNPKPRSPFAHVRGHRRAQLPDSQRGSVLIIVIWVCLGLVALTVYFANSMSAELRAADNRAAEIDARQAVAAGTRYAAYVLTHFGSGGTVPYYEDYSAEAVPVGEAMFWFIGRDNDVPPGEIPVFGLVDESSKLNLNTASRSMLEALPGITPELVDAILAWRRRSGDFSGSVDSNTYARMDPPRLNKGGLFESVDELRLLYGATLDVLYGEDTNRNGALDLNEDDADATAPRDDQNGSLFAGIAEYVTVYSRQSTRSAEGLPRIDIRTQQSRDRAGLRNRLQQKLDPGRVAQIISRIGNDRFESVVEFMWESGMTEEEYALVHTDFTHGDGIVTGLVNVNTASEVVLTCLFDVDDAAALIAYRQANPDALTSFAWLRQVISRGAAARVGRYLTDHSYQFSADVAAVGRLGRGYARARTVFDTSSTLPRIIFHQDLSHHGWALGPGVREWLRTGRDTGT